MVPSGRLLAFAAAALIIIVIPGPSVLFVVGRALAHGRRVALASVLGNEAGSLVLVVLVAAGVGPLVERSALIFTALKLAGALAPLRPAVADAAAPARGALLAPVPNQWVPLAT